MSEKKESLVYFDRAVERLENGYSLTKNASQDGPKMRIEHQEMMVALAANHIALGRAYLEAAAFLKVLGR